MEADAAEAGNLESVGHGAGGRSEPAGGGARRRRWAWWLLLLAVLALVVESWYPFRPELPFERRTAPLTSAGSVASFDGGSLLVSAPGVPWVADAATTGELQVHLEFRTDRVDQEGPARLFVVSKDTYNADLMIGQDGADLVVRLRRPGSDAGGDPAFVIPDVFTSVAPGTWRALDLAVGQGRLSAQLDGTPRLDEPATISDWDPDYRVALGDEPRGERGWVGDLRNVHVTTPGTSSDVLTSGMVDNGSGVVWKTRVRGLTSLSNGDPIAVVLLRMAAFVPVGLALAYLLGRRRAVLGVVGLVVLLTLGKAFVEGRHPRLADVVVCLLGGLLGVLVAERLASGSGGRRRTGPPSSDPPSRPGTGSVPATPSPMSPSMPPDPSNPTNPSNPSNPPNSTVAAGT